MTNEEKARRIALDAKERGFGATESYCAAMDMAEWKDKVKPTKPTITVDDIKRIFEIEESVINDAKYYKNEHFVLTEDEYYEYVA